ncbi:MAG: hypothetical protein JW913_05860 [Chitinispirillaceae bacterium]|nr:hypothetical protein [Chitinispirillaceae bacterium]
MTTGAVLSVTSTRIALFSKRNENRFGESLIRLASGRRVNKPSDNIPDYFFSDKMMRESRSYTTVLRNIGEGMAFTDVAVSVGEQVFNGITGLREIVRHYYSEETTDDEKAALGADFSARQSTVIDIIASSNYDGAQIVSDNGGVPFKSIALDDGTGTQKMEISFDSGDIAYVSELSLGVTDEARETAAVEAELEKAGLYLAKGSAYMRGLNAHYNLATIKMLTTRASAERSVESDTGEEMIRAMNYSIRNQSSMAMLAQANMYQASVVKLLGW